MSIESQYPKICLRILGRIPCEQRGPNYAFRPSFTASELQACCIGLFLSSLQPHHTTNGYWKRLPNSVQMGSYGKKVTLEGDSREEVHCQYFCTFIREKKEQNNMNTFLLLKIRYSGEEKSRNYVYFLQESLFLRTSLHRMIWKINGVMRIFSKDFCQIF